MVFPDSFVAMPKGSGIFSLESEIKECIAYGFTVRTDWLESIQYPLESEAESLEKAKCSGQKGVGNLQWVHILISHMKMSIRGINRDVSYKHIFRYMAEFCYRLNR